MSDITLDLRSPHGGRRQQQVAAAIEHVGEDEHLTVIVDRRDAHETDEIFRILNEHHFDYQPKTGADGAYEIHARRQPQER